MGDTNDMMQRSFPTTMFLLILPTMILGSATFYLLFHERDRIAQQAQRAVAFKARTLAEEVAGIIGGVQTDLQQALLAIDGPDPIGKLEEQKRTNPLIRNVFVWQPGVGLVYPDAAESLSREEARFVARYDRLFSSVTRWWRSDEDGAQEPSAMDHLLSLKQQATLNLATPDPNVARGWETWFWEDRLNFLGWVQPAPGMPVRGVEIEMVSLMSQILPQLGPFDGDPVTYAIIDHNGDLFHQIGPADVASILDRADVSEPIGPGLPQWRVAAFPEVPTGQSTGDRFFLIAVCLLVLVVASIVLSGISLLVHARRQILDARQKSTFVSNVSHELKTPLTSIRLYAELLRQDRVPDPEKRRHLLDVIVDESHRLSRLVHNVLQFSRLERGATKYQPEKTDLNVFVNRVVDQHRHRVGESGIDLKTRLPDASLWVSIDHDALEQVMVNLIDNAIKYGRSPSGDDILCIEVSSRGGFALISVQDNGPGIPAELSEKIFEKFFRIDDSLTAEQAGSGIGLSISRLLIRDLGGDLTHRAGTPGGSCFEIRLPLLETEAPNAFQNDDSHR